MTWIRLMLFMMLVWLLGMVSLSLLGGSFMGLFLVHVLTGAGSAILLCPDRRQKAACLLCCGLLAPLLLLAPEGLRGQLLLQEILLSGLLFYMTRLTVTPDLGSYFRLKRVPLYWLVLLLPASLLLILIAGQVNAFSMLFYKAQKPAALGLAAGHLPAGLVILCLMPAVVEELLFRGAVLRSIEGRKKALFLSSLLFALWHLNPGQFAYAFAAGLLLSCLVLWTDNLTSSIIVHFLFNLFNLLFAVWEEGRSTWADRGTRELIKKSYEIVFPPLLSPAGELVWQNLARAVCILALSLLAFFGLLRGMKQSD